MDMVFSVVLSRVVKYSQTPRAYFQYEAELDEGNDGRPHYEARKSCKYLEEAVEVSKGGQGQEEEEQQAYKKVTQ